MQEYTFIYNYYTFIYLYIYYTIIHNNTFIYTFRVTPPDVKLSCSQQLDDASLKAKALHGQFMQHSYFRRESWCLKSEKDASAAVLPASERGIPLLLPSSIEDCN